MRKENSGIMFEKWLATYLEQDQREINRLLNDKTATNFLITWSLFEARCFKGFATVPQFSSFTKKIIKAKSYKKSTFLKAGKHFHIRYQDKSRYNNLMYKQKSQHLKDIFLKKINELTDYEIIFMLIFVVYRFRNNIFHGNKGVNSWLQYKEQIELCLSVMQVLIMSTKAIQDENA